MGKSCGHESTEGSREAWGEKQKEPGSFPLQGRRTVWKTTRARKIPERARAAQGGGRQGLHTSHPQRPTAPSVSSVYSKARVERLVVNIP